MCYFNGAKAVKNKPFMRLENFLFGIMPRQLSSVFTAIISSLMKQNDTNTFILVLV